MIFWYDKLHIILKPRKICEHSSICLDNMIIVDGNYRWIPSRMRPAEHEKGVSYDAGESEFNFTPTDGKGI